MVWLILIITVGIIFIPITLFNNLRTRKNQVQFSESSIDVQLKKRHDLIPSLVEVVKGHAKHEREILIGLAQARSEAMIGSTGTLSSKRIQQEGILSQFIGQTLAIAEDYPELQSDKQFIYLQRMLAEVEEQISAARRFFNSAVNDYNNAVETFPSSLIASMMNYQPLPYFSMPEFERSSPRVDLS